jgi:hypothetical protein
VDRLRKKLETAEKEKTELEAFQHNTVIQLSQKERERTGKLSTASPRALKIVVNTYSCTDQPVYRLGE